MSTHKNKIHSHDKKLLDLNKLSINSDDKSIDLNRKNKFDLNRKTKIEFKINN